METYPLRQGYAGEAPQNLTALIRKVIGDWDGTNWLSVRHHLEEHATYEKPLDDWTIEDVYQRFAIGWRKLANAAGGIVATAAMTITPIPAIAEVKIVPKRKRRKPNEQTLTSQGLRLVAALCQWHEISANGKDVLFNKQKPAIRCREVEREFAIPSATASEQFKELFDSHRAYSQKWERNPQGLAYKLAMLNGEVFCLGGESSEEQFSESETED